MNERDEMSEEKGNCYVRALTTLSEGEQLRDILTLLEAIWPDAELQLVHGFPIGTGGNAKGLKYGHAWLEFGEYVLDCGTIDGDSVSLLPRPLYYQLGSIIDEECVRYSAKQAWQHVAKHGHAGPWIDDSELPIGVVFA